MTIIEYKTDDIVFDDVVIGSSPMMLIQASALACQGRKVCLVEREEVLGGSWKTASTENGERVEIACHVIEYIPGVYEFLQTSSGVKFAPLKSQPIRIHPSGFIFQYFSRFQIFATGIRLIIGLIWQKIRLAFAMTNDRNRLINFQMKFKSYLRVQLGAFFKKQLMQGPQNGFVNFIDKLVENCKINGVVIKNFDVKKIQYIHDERWVLSDINDIKISGNFIHCTTSTNLHQIAPGHFEGKTLEFSRRTSLIAEVLNDNINVNQTYVAFWSDPYVARISRIDIPQKQSYERYLIELHDSKLMSQLDWLDKIRDKLHRAKIIREGGAFKIVGQVSCLFTNNVDQLPAGEIDINFKSYYSMGNLAAGIALWKKQLNKDPI